MNRGIINRFLGFCVVLLVQVLVLNNVHILGVVTPLLLVYPILCFHRGANRISLLLWSFAFGVIYDMFSDTWGMGTFTNTLLGLIQPGLLNLFSPHDDDDEENEFEPDLYSMGIGHFLAYAFFGCLIYHAVFNLLNAFNISSLVFTLIAIGGGTLLTLVIIFFTELIIRKRR